MPQAEEVLTDVARQASGLVQELWRRRPRGKADLPELLRQLELVITSAFGISMQLQLLRAPQAPKPRSRRLFGSEEAPAAVVVHSQIPATDGRSIWLPAATQDSEVIKNFDNLRVMALQQAARVHRGSIATLQQANDPMVRAIYEVLEADAADIDLVTRFRGLTGPLNVFRRMTLEQRPIPAQLAVERRPLEQWIREILEIPCEAAAQTREHSASRSLQLASELAPELLKAMPDVARELAGVLHRDFWIGELRLAAVAEPEAVATSPDLRLSAAQAAAIEAGFNEDATLPRVLPAWLDPEQAGAAGLDPAMEITQPFTTAAVVVRSQLQLSTAVDVELGGDAPGGQGIAAHSEELAYPEWDWQTCTYRTPGAAIALLPAWQGPQEWVADALHQHRTLLHGICQRFEALRAHRLRVDAVDTDSHVDACGDGGVGLPQQSASRATRSDMATLLLIDVSAASQEWVSSTHQLIDLEREALLLACIALHSLGEPFSVYAFCSEGSQRVTMRCIKQFNEGYGDDVALRIAGLRPERHTRTGAALRHATALLARETAQQRMLLLFSDGAPNDAEDYHGRHGMEDVRQAVREARLQGISSLCFTTDQPAGNYLPAVFGEQQSTVLYRPELLPSALTQWLHRLMRL